MIFPFLSFLSSFISLVVFLVPSLFYLPFSPSSLLSSSSTYSLGVFVCVSRTRTRRQAHALIYHALIYKFISLSDRGFSWGGWRRKEGKEGEEVTCLVAKAERDRRRNEEEEKEEEEGERVCFFPLFIYFIYL